MGNYFILLRLKSLKSAKDKLRDVRNAQNDSYMPETYKSKKACYAQAFVNLIHPICKKVKTVSHLLQGV